MISGLRRKRSGIGAVLRAVSLAIFFAFAVGFGIGLWIRCAMERPEGYLADNRALPTRSGAAPLPLDVRLAGAPVGDPREHKE